MKGHLVVAETRLQQRGGEADVSAWASERVSADAAGRVVERATRRQHGQQAGATCAMLTADRSHAAKAQGEHTQVDSSGAGSKRCRAAAGRLHAVGAAQVLTL